VRLTQPTNAVTTGRFAIRRLCSVCAAQCCAARVPAPLRAGGGTLQPLQRATGFQTQKSALGHRRYYVSGAPIYGRSAPGCAKPATLPPRHHGRLGYAAPQWTVPSLWRTRATAQSSDQKSTLRSRATIASSVTRPLQIFARCRATSARQNRRSSPHRSHPYCRPLRLLSPRRALRASHRHHCAMLCKMMMTSAPRSRLGEPHRVMRPCSM
jgi:hypothetical protein